MISQISSLARADMHLIEPSGGALLHLLVYPSASSRSDKIQEHHITIHDRHQARISISMPACFHDTPPPTTKTHDRAHHLHPSRIAHLTISIISHHPSPPLTISSRIVASKWLQHGKSVVHAWHRTTSLARPLPRKWGTSLRPGAHLHTSARSSGTRHALSVGLG